MGARRKTAGATFDRSDEGAPISSTYELRGADAIGDPLGVDGFRDVLGPVVGASYSLQRDAIRCLGVLGLSNEVEAELRPRLHRALVTRLNGAFGSSSAWPRKEWVESISVSERSWWLCVVLSEHAGFAMIVARTEGGVPQDGVQIEARLSAFAAAVRTEIELEEERTVSAALSSSLSALGLGIVVLEADGRIRHASETALQIVDEHDGLIVADERLGLLDPEDDAKFREHVHELSIARAGATTSMRVKRPSDGAAITLRMSAGSSGRARYVVVAVDRPERVERLTPEMLAELFELTRAESKLAAALVKGSTLKEAANELSVGIETVRTQLKQLMKKTDTHRQADLIRVLLGGPNRSSESR